MKVSVVVITYNQEETIGEALDSILMQECDFNFEIVIGDDCSTDGTTSICSRYAEKYPEIIRLFVNERNKGIQDNYYDCMLRCRGEYICDLAGDDKWIDPHKLQKQAEILDADTDVTLCVTGFKSSQVHKITGSHVHKSEGGEVVERLLRHEKEGTVHLCTAMFRRDIFRKIYHEDEDLFRNKEYVVEDLQLATMLANEGKVAFLPDITLEYRVSETSFSGTNDFTKLFDLYFGSMELTRRLEKKTGVEHEKLLPMYSRFSHYLLMQAFHSEDDERRHKLIAGMKRWDVKPCLKSRVILGITSNRRLWCLSRHVWQFLRN